MASERLFLLSPATCSGPRARLLLRERASFELAERLRSAGGVPVGEVFSFLSGLYFRGKLAYARTFARSEDGRPGVLIITPDRGLMLPEEPVTGDDLRDFAAVPIDVREPRYRMPLERDLRELTARLPDSAEVVLLGSIATGKYLDVLSAHLNGRLVFPAEFVGRGDMSRGALALASAREGRELDYLPAASLGRHAPPGAQRR